MTQQYTTSDLQISKSAAFERSNGVIAHTHTIQFGRVLTRAEQHFFADVLIGFYYTVHFSQQFGNGLVAEPVIEFLNETEARYTLRQTELSGSWKEMLFSILANFSQEVAPIHLHDNSRAFDPTYTPQFA